VSRIAVIGATGVVGRALVPLLAVDHDVVAIARRPADWPQASVAPLALNAADGPALADALRGCEVVYHLVHSLGTSDFHARDLAVADAVASAAEAVGAKQIVYLGGLGDDGDDLSEHLRSRREVGIRLAARTTPVTTLRSAIVIGRGSAAFVTITALVDRLPGMICPRWVSTPTQPVALADIARVLVGVAGCSEALGQTYDVGGPEVMTYREMLERVARLRGRRLVIVEVPVLTPRLSSLWITLVTPVHASVARPLVEGLRNRTVAADDRIRELVPFEPTPFDVAARDALN
jgi:uncharacterized protein YbjT (DUF2867 family)